MVYGDSSDLGSITMFQQHGGELSSCITTSGVMGVLNKWSLTHYPVAMPFGNRKKNI